jgi:hypothetical protein
MMDEQQSVTEEPVTGAHVIGSPDGEAPHSVVAESRQSARQMPGALTLGERLLRWLGISREQKVDQLTELNRAINTYPDAAVNYVLRGEVYAELGEYALAKADFEHGLMLAEAQFAGSDWGFLAQALRDRALVGLDRTRRRLNT